MPPSTRTISLENRLALLRRSVFVLVHYLVSSVDSLLRLTSLQLVLCAEVSS